MCSGLCNCRIIREREDLEDGGGLRAFMVPQQGSSVEAGCDPLFYSAFLGELKAAVHSAWCGLEDNTFIRIFLFD